MSHPDLPSRVARTRGGNALHETVGEMSAGMVFLDPAGIPLKYDQRGP